MKFAGVIPCLTDMMKNLINVRQSTITNGTGLNFGASSSVPK